MPMTRAELQSLHEKLCQEARETQVRKNHDYATEADIFRNFRYFGGLGILVRMSDKLARLRSFEENGVFKVEDEKLADTIQDLINYAVIYYAYKHDEPLPPEPVQADESTMEEVLGLGPTIQEAPAVTMTIDTSYPSSYWRPDGPYCEACGKLAAFRYVKGFDEAVYYCHECVEDLPMDMVSNLTAMVKV